MIRCTILFFSLILPSVVFSQDEGSRAELNSFRFVLVEQIQKMDLSEFPRRPLPYRNRTRICQILPQLPEPGLAPPNR